MKDNEASRKEFIIKIQEFYSQGYSKRKIVKMLGISHRRLNQYISGDPDKLCIHGNKDHRSYSLIEGYEELIQDLLQKKMPKTEILKQLKSSGYEGSYTRLCEYCIDLNEGRTPKASNDGLPKHIDRKKLLNYLWSGTEIPNIDIKVLKKRFPKIDQFAECIGDFKKIYEEKNKKLLFEFIDKYKSSGISKFQSFANGLTKDIDAVVNSVIMEYSNGFVEGQNSRLKMIKRTMYGRAKLPLLRAKVLQRNIF